MHLKDQSATVKNTDRLKQFDSYQNSTREEEIEDRTYHEMIGDKVDEHFSK